MIKKLFFVVSLLGIANHALSQTAQPNNGFMPGYIVKVDNDTLYGEVKFRQDDYTMLENIRYRKSPDSKIESYLPSSLKSFQLGRYSYLVASGGYYQQITKGKVSAYERREHKYVTRISSPSPGTTSTVRVRSDQEKSIILLIRKDGRKLRYENNQKLISKSLKKELNDFFSDEPLLIEKISKSYYTNADIIYMVYEFNEPAKYQLKVIDEKQYKQEKAARKKESGTSQGSLGLWRGL